MVQVLTDNGGPIVLSCSCDVLYEISSSDGGATFNGMHCGL